MIELNIHNKIESPFYIIKNDEMVQ